MEWFENWFDENYLKLYSHRNMEDAEKQINLIINTLNPDKHETILDLGCGEGRHCIIFKDRGFNIKGIDLSETLINSGKNKEPALDIEVGDIREIKGKFSIILSLFTSFGYFQRDYENMKALNSISNALKHAGWFWIDFLNPEFLKSRLVPESEKTLHDGTRVTEMRRIENGMVIKDIIFETGETYSEKIKLFTKEKLETMLEKSGIAATGVFGSYLGEPWNKSSERTIIYGKKVR